MALFGGGKRKSRKVVPADVPAAEAVLYAGDNPVASIRSSDPFEVASFVSPGALRGPWTTAGRIPRDPRLAATEDDDSSDGEMPDVVSKGKGEGGVEERDAALKETKESALERAKAERDAALERVREARLLREKKGFEEMWDPVLQDAEGMHSLALVNRSSMLPLDERMFAMEGLRHVTLQGLNLEEVPDCIGKPWGSSVTKFVLSGNLLTTVPPSFCALQNLHTLALARNQLTTIPDALLSLSTLTELDVTSNKISSIPASFGDAFPLLTYFNLDSNRCNDLPESLTKLTSLQTLNLNNNEFFDVPPWIGHRTPFLERILMAKNRVDRFPVHVAGAPKLHTLVLANNALSGSMPRAMVQCTNLKTLHLDWNQIEELPLQITTMTNLQTLKLEGNPLRRPRLEDIKLGSASAALAWTRRHQATMARVRQKGTFDMFRNVLRVVEKEGFARPAIFTPDLEMKFETGVDMYHCIDWNPFFEEVWPKAREHWARAQLPIPGEQAPKKAIGGWGGGGEGAARGGGAGGERKKERRRSSLEMLQEKQEDLKDPPGTFWSRGKDEILAILLAHRDAYGPVLRTGVWGLFRDCVCRDADGLSRICIPPRRDYACMRLCVVFKAGVTNPFAEDDSAISRWTEAAIRETEVQAEEAALEWANSEEGKDYFMSMARDRAEQDDAETRRADFAAGVQASLQPKRAAIRAAYDLKRGKLFQEHRERVNILREREREIIRQLEVGEAADTEVLKYELAHLPTENEETTKARAEGIHEELMDGDRVRREVLRHELGVVRVAIARGPSAIALEENDKEEKETLARVDEEAKALIARYKPLHPFVLSVRRALVDSHRALIRKHYDLAVRHYVQQRRRDVKKAVIAKHARLRIVIGNWRSAGLRKIFTAWQTYAHQARSAAHRVADADERAATHAARQAEAYELARLERLKKWDKSIDPFSDLPMWVHKDTGETRFDDPANDPA